MPAHSEDDDRLSPARLADALLPVTLAAGRLQMGYFRSGAQVQTKSDATPVTIADQESEALIFAALRAIAPGIPVVAEEATAAGQIPVIGSTFFLVDPLDGTREFIAGRSEFTVNIALIREATPVFGLVYAPATGDLFVTTSESCAVRASVTPQASVSALRALDARPVHVRRADPQRVDVFASRSFFSPDTAEFLARFSVSAYKSMGSSIKFCLIAAGEADLYPRVGPTCEWDTAAGQAILTAAGGKVTTFTGDVLRYGKAVERFRNPDFIAWGGW